MVNPLFPFPSHTFPLLNLHARLWGWERRGKEDDFPFFFLFFLGKVREGKRINYNLPTEKTSSAWTKSRSEDSIVDAIGIWVFLQTTFLLLADYNFCREHWKQQNKKKYSGPCGLRFRKVLFFFLIFPISSSFPHPSFILVLCCRPPGGWWS